MSAGATVPPSEPGEETTVLDVLAAFAAAGYTADFVIVPDGIRCRTCGHSVRAEELQLEHLRRLEGASDPDDMQAVLGVACPHCGARGALVVHYGPEAGPIEADLLLHLPDDRAGRGAIPEI